MESGVKDALGGRLYFRIELNNGYLVFRGHPRNLMSLFLLVSSLFEEHKD